MNLKNFKAVYEKTINGSTDDSKLRNYIRSIVEEVVEYYSTTEHKVEIEEETDPTKLSIRQLTKYIMDELEKYNKSMEPWTNELRRKQKESDKRKPLSRQGFTEPGKSGPDFGPRGPRG